jgi:hypothetical protein
MNVQSRAAIVTPAVVVVFVLNNGSVRMVHTFRDARSVVADLITNPLGIGSLRKHEPQRSGNNAEKYLAHWNSLQNPFRALIATATILFRDRPCTLNFAMSARASESGHRNSHAAIPTADIAVLMTPRLHSANLPV